MHVREVHTSLYITRPYTSKVTLKLFGTMQIIFFLTKFFEFFREYSTDEQNCEYAALVKAFKIILLGSVLKINTLTLDKFFQKYFRAIGAAAITALRSANYQSTLEEALQVYEIEIVILVLKRCRTLAICHVFFAFW